MKQSRKLSGKNALKHHHRNNQQVILYGNVWNGKIECNRLNRPSLTPADTTQKLNHNTCSCRPLTRSFIDIW